MQARGSRPRIPTFRMKSHFLSIMPILFSHIVFGAPNSVSAFHELETNVAPGLLLRRDPKPVSRDFLCGYGWR